MTVKENDEIITIFKNYNGSGNELKNLKILNSNEYKRQQLIKNQIKHQSENSQCSFTSVCVLFLIKLRWPKNESR